MNLSEVMAELESLGSDQTVKIYRNHGADGDMYGVKIADLKKILRKIKGDQDLALQLWDTGNSDAMYLAGLLADGTAMTKRQLDGWAKSAWWYMLSEHAVPFAAGEHPDALSIGKKWMKSKKENIASSGWTTYTAAISVRPDSELDKQELKSLLKRVEQEIDEAPNRVRYCMNSFVIASGSFVKSMFGAAKSTAKKIGKVQVDVGNTSCRVPLATEQLDKIKSMDRLGQKRKSVKC